MKFAEKLLKHPEFLQLQKRVQEMEQDRIYCHHELSHALDVCRMAWMMYLEDEYKTHLKDYRQKKEAKAGTVVKVGDVIEVQFGNGAVRAEITQITETTRKEEAKEMYKILP